MKSIQWSGSRVVQRMLLVVAAALLACCAMPSASEAQAAAGTRNDLKHGIAASAFLDRLLAASDEAMVQQIKEHAEACCKSMLSAVRAADPEEKALRLGIAQTDFRNAVQAAVDARNFTHGLLREMHAEEVRAQAR